MARLVFLGTPEVAVPPLRELVAAGHDVALVVTRADKRRSRRGELPSPVRSRSRQASWASPSPTRSTTSPALGPSSVWSWPSVGSCPRLSSTGCPWSTCTSRCCPDGAARRRWSGRSSREMPDGRVPHGRGGGSRHRSGLRLRAGRDRGGRVGRTSRGRLVDMGCALLRRYLADGLAGLPGRGTKGTPSYADKIVPAQLDSTGMSRRSASAARPPGPGLDDLPWPPSAGARGTGSLRRGRCPLPEPGTLDSETATVLAGPGTPAARDRAAEGPRPMSATEWIRGARPSVGERLGA